MDITFDAKVRRSQFDLKEPKDGTDRLIASLTLTSETLPFEEIASLLRMQKDGMVRVRIEAVQAELPLGANGEKRAET